MRTHFVIIILELFDFHKRTVIDIFPHFLASSPLIISRIFYYLSDIKSNDKTAPTSLAIRHIPLTKSPLVI